MYNSMENLYTGQEYYDTYMDRRNPGEFLTTYLLSKSIVILYSLLMEKKKKPNPVRLNLL